MSTTTPDLLQSFLDEAWETVVVFEQTPEFLAIGRHEPLVVMAHRLKGSAGLYGFPQTAQLAALAERILEGAARYNEAQRERVALFMEQLTAVLSTALENIAISGKEGPVGLELARLGAARVVQELAELNPEALAPPEETAPPPAPEEGGVVEALRRFHQQNQEFWEFFAPETLENLELAQQALLQMETGDPEGEHLRALFRAMHTIKGAAYSVGCQPIGAFAHQLEDLLTEVREGRLAWGPAIAQAVLEGTQVIGQMLRVAEGKENAVYLTQAQNRLAQLLGRAAPAPDPSAPLPQREPSRAASVRVSLERLDALLNIAGEVLVTRSRLALMAQRFEELENLLEAARERLLRTTTDFEARYLNPRLSLSQEASSPAQTTLGKTVQELFTELEFDRYDDLNILARSIQEMTSDITEIRNSLSEQIKAFQQETEQFGKLAQALRSEVGRARLVPIGRLYQRLSRQVQQLAKGKAVEIRFQGEQVELDSVVLEGLSEALIHLVNNALAHGIESPEERLARGKPAKGTLKLRSYTQRNALVLEVSDDGRGIDLEALKQKAVEKGFCTPEEVRAMGPEEAIELIFLPGLSTASEVSDVAGRGVGMEAVANAVRRLRGELSVETQAGLGTTFRLRLPQNLVVSDLLLLEVGGQVLALPRENLLTLLIAPKNQPEVLHQGQPVPIQPLHRLLGLPEGEQDEYALALVEGRGGQWVALGADRFLGLEQSLVKPLQPPLAELPHLLGATISPTGEVILVLSPSGLLAFSSAAPTPRSETPAEKRLPVLLVDDSLSVRRVVGQMLRKAGYSVITAADGQEALEILEQQTFRAVVTDLEMPRMSGFELLEELRRRPHLAHLPVAVLTTRASAKHRDLALELGANAYLTKPADAVELERFLRAT
ncbi:response regulator [Meiothermus sp. QL-1]|uniref:hybrid sensor histidine kinase/response regulator n=1 Tax=Meiothermus sp. QL-1 TaxID=2058095 RepID=UPI000E0C8978|nr:response regulator [Meiothermus sp. QL-1]RDI96044.1 response regulator [Meiothermus sp. QL-1]